MSGSWLSGNSCCRRCWSSWTSWRAPARRRGSLFALEIHLHACRYAPLGVQTAGHVIDKGPGAGGDEARLGRDAEEGAPVGTPAGQQLDQQSLRDQGRSEEHTSELQSRPHLVCRLLLEKKKNNTN